MYSDPFPVPRPSSCPPRPCRRQHLEYGEPSACPLLAGARPLRKELARNSVCPVAPLQRKPLPRQAPGPRDKSLVSGGDNAFVPSQINKQSRLEVCPARCRRGAPPLEIGLAFLPRSRAARPRARQRPRLARFAGKPCLHVQGGTRHCRSHLAPGPSS